MLRLNINKFIYICYFMLIIISYVISFDIVPTSLNSLLSIILYLSILLPFILIFLSNVQTKIRVDVFILVFLMFCFCIFKILSLILNFDITQAIQHFISYSLFYILTYLIAYKISYTFSLEEILKPFFLMSYIIIFISIAMLSGYQPRYYLNNEDLLQSYLMSSEQKQGLINFAGPYVNQNQFGIMTFISSSILFGKYISVLNIQDIFKSKKLTLAIFLISFFLLIVTISRGAILATLIVILTLVLKSYKSKKNLINLGLFVFFIILMTVFSNNVIDFLIERISNDGTSSRTDIWSNAISTFKDNPLFGVGYYTYSESGASLSAHNAYIQQLASSGTIASIFWISIFLYFFIISISILIKKKMNSKNGQLIFLSALILAILVHQAFEATIIGAFHPLTILLFVSIFKLLKIYKLNESTIVKENNNTYK